jgi:hypothetical protein
MSLSKLSLGGSDLIIHAQGEFDIPAGDRNVVNLFYSVGLKRKFSI